MKADAGVSSASDAGSAPSEVHAAQAAPSDGGGCHGRTVGDGIAEAGIALALAAMVWAVARASSGGW